jgi:hypothetical protein
MNPPSAPAPSSTQAVKAKHASTISGWEEAFRLLGVLIVGTVIWFRRTSVADAYSSESVIIGKAFLRLIDDLSLSSKLFGIAISTQMAMIYNHFWHQAF